MVVRVHAVLLCPSHLGRGWCGNPVVEQDVQDVLPPFLLSYLCPCIPCACNVMWYLAQILMLLTVGLSSCLFQHSQISQLRYVDTAYIHILITCTDMTDTADMCQPVMSA